MSPVQEVLNILVYMWLLCAAVVGIAITIPIVFLFYIGVFCFWVIKKVIRR